MTLIIDERPVAALKPTSHGFQIPWPDPAGPKSPLWAPFPASFPHQNCTPGIPKWNETSPINSRPPQDGNKCNKFSVFVASAVNQLATLGISCEPSDRHQRLQGVESWALPAMPFACQNKKSQVEVARVAKVRLKLIRLPSGKLT